jgi:hypothetical protein
MIIPTPRVENVGEKLHWDLCDFMEVLRKGGVLYIIVIVDDASRLTFTNFLTSKNQRPEFIKTIIAKVKTQKKRDTMKTVHSDGGDEFSFK